MSKGPTPDDAVDTRMSLDHLRGAFGGLSESHHQILVMRELEGLSYRQIGERLGMSRPSVESTLFRARRRLSEEYEELVSGERCRRIQSIITGATGGRVGTRDERKMARHVSYCQPCRRAAFAAGFDADSLTPKRTVREKIAALLPLPAFLKRRLAGHGADDHGSTASVGGQAATLAQLSTAAASYADPVMHWGKAAAKAAAVAAAVVGAGVASHETGLIGGGVPRDERPAAIERQVAPAGGDSAATLSTRPAVQRHDHRRVERRRPRAPVRAAARAPDRRPAPPARAPARRPRPSPAGDDPVKAATGTQLPSADDNPVTKTVRKLTNPDTRGLPVKTPKLPSAPHRSRSPRSRCRRFRSRRSRCPRACPIRAASSAARPARSTARPAPRRAPSTAPPAP